MGKDMTRHGQHGQHAKSDQHGQRAQHEHRHYEQQDMQSEPHGQGEQGHHGQHDMQGAQGRHGQHGRHHRHHRWRAVEGVKTTFVRIGRRMPGVLYEPLEGSDVEESCGHIGILVMHSDEDYLTCPTGPELARRGFRVLCANVENKEGILFTQNDKLRCVQDALLYLRSVAGIDKVVLMGHSGGASLLTAYQCMAENGPDVFAGPERLYPWRAKRPLAPADGIMLLDANWGNAMMQLFSLDPAVTDETSGKNLNADIDLFNPENGFDPEGSSYSDEFIERFQTAQADRNMRLVNKALERLDALDRGEGLYDDDEPFIIPGAAQSFFNNRLFAQDIRLMSRTMQPHPLIHADGSVTEEIVHTVRKPENPRSMTGSFWEGARFLSVRDYLSSYAIRTEPNYGYDDCHVVGVDWQSSYAAAPGNVTRIHVPTLVMGMTGGWDFMASETIYEMSAAEDKHIAYVEGASHKFRPAKEYERFPGEFGDTMQLLHDYVADWLMAGRFDTAAASADATPADAANSYAANAGAVGVEAATNPALQADSVGADQTI